MVQPCLQCIGTVRSPLKDRESAPKQADHTCPEAELIIEEAYLPALHRLHPGQEIVVLTWLHLADRSVLQCHPRGNPENPLHGVLATRSPDRPNPIGLHRVTLLAVNGPVLRVHPLEAVDGTPVVDIKPLLDQENRPEKGLDPREAAELLIAAGRQAWTRGLVSGFNGNLSLRVGEKIHITRSGSIKGALRPEDILPMDLATGESDDDRAVSSEAPMHLEIYRRQPRAGAVVHTHPPHLLALSLLCPERLLGLPLFESGLFADRLARVKDHLPGTTELAHAVGEASRTCDAVFMKRHGLTCWGEDMHQALALTEEFESLARIALLSRTGSKLTDES